MIFEEGWKFEYIDDSSLKGNQTYTHINERSWMNLVKEKALKK